MLPWQWHIRHPNFQKTEVFVVNLLEAIFGEKRKETGIETVFSQPTAKQEKIQTAGSLLSVCFESLCFAVTLCREISTSKLSPNADIINQI